jgi:protein subunit release factor A
VTPIPETELFVQTLTGAENTVKVVHLPTGLTITFGQYQSMRRNKNEAVRRLADKLERR